MAPRRSPLKTLRSRRLAVWLLVGIAAWSILGTAGLDWAYSFPLFLAAVALLFVSTTLCAWERTRLSWREWRSRGVVTDKLVRQLRDRPSAIVGVASPGGALESAETALSGVHLRVRRGPQLAEGVAGRWGLFGSPVFHWSLALLIAVVGLGQMTRSEGFIGVPEGESRTDASESYGTLDEGPLFFGHSGVDIAVSDLQLGFAEGGVDRGAAPIVTLSRGTEVVAEQRVYPNNPLRHGRLLIHMDDYGFAPVIVLQDVAGTEIARETFLVDFDESVPGGLTIIEFGLTDEEGTMDRYRGRLTLALPEDGESTGLANIDVFEEDGLILSTAVETGESVVLPTGEQLVLESVGLYARLAVADDWSVPLIYALLVLASLGISVAVLSPYRKAWVLLVEDETGVRLHVRAKHWRGSPTFADDVVAAIEAAAGAKGAHDDD